MTLEEEQKEEDCSFDTFSFTNESTYPPDCKLQPVHLNINLNFEKWPKKNIKAEIIHTVKCVKPHSVLILNGVGFFNVKVSDFTKNSYKFRYDGNFITIWWNEEWKVNEERKIKIEYDIIEPTSGIEFSENSPFNYEYAITDHEPERARYWLACMDFPSVRQSLEFHFTIPKFLKAFANGLEEKEEELDEKMKISNWKCDHIAPSYLICFGVGKFKVVYDEKVDNEIQVAYVAPDGINLDDLKHSFNETPNIIRYLQTKLKKKFPFPKYYILISPKGGAMENISLPTFGFSFVHDSILTKEYKWNTDRVNIHECAHSYFGDSVVIRHFEHTWLKEGFAKYFEYCWFYDTKGREEGDYQLYSQMKKYMREVDSKYVRPIVTRVYDTSWDMYDSHCYPGGSWRIHQLRNILGEETFWNSITKYLTKFEKKTVETDDFRKMLEEESGINLTRYFDEWFYSKGYPILKGDYSFKEKDGFLIIELQQKQMDKKKEIGLFSFDIEVEFTFIENEQIRVQTEVLSFKDGKSKVSKKIETNVAPKMIRIDPDLKCLFKLDFNPGDEILFENLKKSKDIFNRIRSGLTLIKSSKKNYPKIESILKDELFFGVRETLISEIANQRNEEAALVISNVLETEIDFKALVTITSNCLYFRHPLIKKSLLKFIKKETFGYMSKGNALNALGSQYFETRESADEMYEIIVNEIKKDTKLLYRNYIRIGGYKGLAKLSLFTTKAHDYLVKKSFEEHGESLKTILMYLGDSASKVSEKAENEVKSILSDYLRHDEGRIRKASISGLKSLSAKSELKNLEVSKFTFAHQYQFQIQESIDKIKKSKPSILSDYQKSIDELNKKLSKIENKIEEN
eukprot:gene7656-11976_t